jgi:hypothetical protein
MREFWWNACIYLIYLLHKLMQDNIKLWKCTEKYAYYIHVHTC